MNAQKGFIVPLVIVIIALLAIGSGVYFYSKNKEVAQTSSLTPPTTQVSTSQTSTTTANNSTSVSTTITSNWKTYTNPRFNFSVKYPSDWTEEDYGGDAEDGLYRRGQFNPDQSCSMIVGRHYDCISFSVTDLVISAGNGKVTKDEYIQSLIEGRDYTWVKINGLDALRTELTANGDNQNTKNISYYFFNSNNNEVYKLDIVSDANNPAFNSDYNKFQELVSTFKFNATALSSPTITLDKPTLTLNSTALPLKISGTATNLTNVFVNIYAPAPAKPNGMNFGPGDSVSVSAVNGRWSYTVSPDTLAAMANFSPLTIQLGTVDSLGNTKILTTGTLIIHLAN